MSKHFRFLFVLAALLGALLLASSPAQPVAAQDAAWFTQFWNNRDLSGNPAATRTDQTINFDWGFGSPMPGVNPDNFSARWSRNGQLRARHLSLQRLHGRRHALLPGRPFADRLLD